MSHAATIAQPVDRQRTHAFGLAALVVHQCLSATAAGLAGFGLGVWAFQTTRSATVFSIFALLSQVPRALSMFASGALVDRLEPRRAMLLGNASAALVLVPLLGLFWSGRTDLWHVYVVVALGAVCLSGQWPAASSSVVLLCDQSEYGRANGMLQAANAVSSVLCPMAAGILLSHSSIEAVLAASLGLHVMSVAAIAIVRIPRRAAAPQSPRGSYGQDLRAGLTHLRQDAILLRLTVVMTGSTFLIAIATVLLRPLVLSVASPAVLGTVLSLVGLGLLVGSLAVSARGRAPRTLEGVMLLFAASGVCMMIAGLREWLMLVAAMVFVYSMLQPVVSSGIQTIVQERVPAELQGRIFAMTTAITLGIMPIAAPLGGPLADYVFEPLLMPGGRLAGSIGAVIGTGPGRGIGLLFIVLGAGMVALASAGRVGVRRAS